MKEPEREEDRGKRVDEECPDGTRPLPGEPERETERDTESGDRETGHWRLSKSPRLIERVRRTVDTAATSHRFIEIARV